MTPDIELEFLYDDLETAKSYHDQYGVYVVSVYFDSHPSNKGWMTKKNISDERFIAWCKSLPSYQEDPHNVVWEIGWMSLTKFYFKKQSDVMLFKLTFS